MIVVAVFVSLLLGIGLAAGVAVTSRSVERSAHKREVATLSSLLLDEHGRTADLLTRLAARNIAEYRNYAANPEVDNAAPARVAYLTDPTGLIVVDANDETLEA